MTSSECRVTRRRVLAVASGGGHWVQLLRLAPALVDHEVHFVSVSADDRDQIPFGSFHVVPDATRWDRLKTVRLAVRTALLVLAVRPQVVVTTGAAPGLLAIVFGRLVGARTIWLDSIANASRMSMSGESAKSWSTERRVAARIEATRQGLDIRYVITNIGGGSAWWLYESLYCARGNAENLIKLHKTQLASDRTSCRSPLANQMRLILHTAVLADPQGSRRHPRDPQAGPRRIRHDPAAVVQGGGSDQRDGNPRALAFAATCPEAALFRSLVTTLCCRSP